MNILQYKSKPAPAICISCSAPFHRIKPHHRKCRCCHGMVRKRIAALLKSIESADKDQGGVS